MTPTTDRRSRDQMWTRKYMEAFVRRLTADYYGVPAWRRIYFEQAGSDWPAFFAAVKAESVTAAEGDKLAAAHRVGVQRVPRRPREDEQAVRRAGEDGSDEQMEALIQQYGRTKLNKALQLWAAGETAQQLRFNAHLHPSVVAKLLRVFAVRFPQYAACAVCKRPRTRGLVMVPQESGHLLCWQCDRYGRGELTERERMVKEATRLYSEGVSRVQIEQGLGIHWRLSALGAKLAPPEAKACYACQRIRRRGVAFEPVTVQLEDGTTARRPHCRECAALRQESTLAARTSTVNVASE